MSGSITRRFIVTMGVAGVVAAASVPAPARAQGRTIKDGVYTSEQAAHGKEVYREQCSACHANNLLGGEMAPGLVGSGFIGGWSGETLWSLADFTNATMPQDAPGRLTAEQLNDVIAFVLEANEYPAGAGELAVDLTNEGDPIRIE